VSNKVKDILQTEAGAMKCEWTVQDLSAYMDGELGSQQAQRLREHLAICSECRRQAGALKQTASLVRAMPEVAPPADLRARAARLMASAAAATTCDEALMWASQQMDGELPVQQVVALERHLQECKACRDQARAMERAAALVKQLPEVNPPLRIRAAIHNRLAQRERALRIRRAGWTAGWLTMAGAAAVVLIAVRMHRPGVPAVPVTGTAAPPAIAQATQPAQPAPAATPPSVAALPAAPATEAGKAAPEATARPEGSARRIARAVARAFGREENKAAPGTVQEASMMGAGDVLRRAAKAGVELVMSSGPRDTVEEPASGAPSNASGSTGAGESAATAAPAESAAATQPLQEAKKPEASVVQAILEDVKKALSARPLPLQPIRAELKRDKSAPDPW
jgi:anti-sigma factor (TIGR02949 family)